MMLPVYFEDRLLGRIEEKGHGVLFAYDQQWRAQDDAFPISLTMRLQNAEYPPEAATPWFANLLPEERILEQTARNLGRSQGDVYGLLEEIGRETAGALSIGGPESRDRADYRPLSEAGLAEAIATVPARPLLAGDGDVTMSLAGAQSKFVVAVFDGRINLPLRGAASTHIVKPASDRLYATVENELLCMRLAHKVGLQVPATQMGVADGRRYLMIERYDRKIRSSGRVERIHQEDFCQALGIFPVHKYEARRGPRLVDCFNVLDAHSVRSARDRLALLDLIVFGCCIGDTDRHGKNYSLLLAGERVRLAPGYDLMTALAYDGITTNLAMRIAGKNRAEHLERRHWERFARDVRLSPAATVRRVEELGSSVAEQTDEVMSGLIEEFPVDSRAIRLFGAKIIERARKISANSVKNTTVNDPDDGAMALEQ